ncbi:MAG: FkbM family methyltransferase [Actinomycetota bacterium]|nr:FkbM family methyltransferase [Actinomycetota bacterium]
MPSSSPSPLSSLRRRLHRAAAPAAAAQGAPVDAALAAVLDRDRLDMENMRRLVAFSLAPDSRCVDVGAHHGALLQEIIRVAPHGYHTAYEPLPHLAAHLRQRFPAADVRQAALSDHAGQTTFSHVRGTAEGCSGFQVVTAPPGYADDVEQIQVKLERLDDMLAGEDRLDLLKVDVEGAEQQVFEGALETLRRTQPIVLFEHTFAASNAYGTEPQMIYTLLCERAGLRLFDLNGNGPFTPGEFETLSRAGDPINFVAHV